MSGWLSELVGVGWVNERVCGWMREGWGDSRNECLFSVVGLCAQECVSVRA